MKFTNGGVLQMQQNVRTQITCSTPASSASVWWRTDWIDSLAFYYEMSRSNTPIKKLRPRSPRREKGRANLLFAVLPEVERQRGLIRYSRGRVAILDGRRLEGLACSYYATAKETYARVMRHRANVAGGAN
jgi:hypothetical protein